MFGKMVVLDASPTYAGAEGEYKAVTEKIPASGTTPVVNPGGQCHPGRYRLSSAARFVLPEALQILGHVGTEVCQVLVGSMAQCELVAQPHGAANDVRENR